VWKRSGCFAMSGRWTACATTPRPTRPSLSGAVPSDSAPATLATALASPKLREGLHCRNRKSRGRFRVPQRNRWHGEKPTLPGRLSGVFCRRARDRSRHCWRGCDTFPARFGARTGQSYFHKRRSERLFRFCSRTHPGFATRSSVWNRPREAMRLRPRRLNRGKKHPAKAGGGGL
jgi:hypothetical protein